MEAGGQRAGFLRMEVEPPARWYRQGSRDSPSSMVERVGDGDER